MIKANGNLYKILQYKQKTDLRTKFAVSQVRPHPTQATSANILMACYARVRIFQH